MPRGLLRLAGDPLRQQHALDRVQPAVLPRLQVNRVTSSPSSQWSRNVLSFLFARYGFTTVGEELRVLLRQEEVQLVAGVLRVQRPLLLGLQLRPRQDEGELGELRVLRQRRVEARRPWRRLSYISNRLLDRRRRARTACPFGEHRHLLLLREVLGRVEPVLQPQIDERAPAVPAA